MLIFLYRFIHTDLHTIAVVLFWGNFSLCFLIFFFYYKTSSLVSNNLVRYFIYSKLLQAIAWGLILSDNLIPYFLSRVGAMWLLLAAAYFESNVMLELSGLKSRTLQRIQMTLFGLLLVNLYFFESHGLESFTYSPLFSSLSLFLIYAIPSTCLFINSRGSRLRHAVGITYALFIVLILAYLLAPLSQSSLMIIFFKELKHLSLVLVAYSGTASFLLLLNENANKEIAELAMKDVLTGFYNRRFFNEEARQILGDHARKKRMLSLLFLDIDHFKLVNDSYGHHFGDMVIRDFASVVKLQVRPLDLACRYGGEEFLVLLPDTEQAGALTVAERLIELFRQSSFTDKPGFFYTASCGLYSVIPTSGSIDELQSIISKSDEALYLAKKNGRNRTEIYREI